MAKASARSDDRAQAEAAPSDSVPEPPSETTPPVADADGTLEKQSHSPEEPLMQLVASMAAHPAVSEKFRDGLNAITPEQMREWIGVAPRSSLQDVGSSELPTNGAGLAGGPGSSAASSKRPPLPLTKAVKRKRRRDEARRRQQAKAASRSGRNGSA